MLGPSSLLDAVDAEDACDFCVLLRFSLLAGTSSSLDGAVGAVRCWMIKVSLFATLEDIASSERNSISLGGNPNNTVNGRNVWDIQFRI